MRKSGFNKTENSAIVRVPEGFDFKVIVEKELEKSGVNIIYVDCKMETPYAVFEKVDQAGWHVNVSSVDIERSKTQDSEKVSSILLIDHFSDLADQRVRMHIESVLKGNRDMNICGKKNIPVILTFSNDEGMAFFYRNDFNIYDERYWK
jgi:hypothetical protein